MHRRGNTTRSAGSSILRHSRKASIARRPRHAVTEQRVQSTPDESFERTSANMTLRQTVLAM